MKIKKGDSVVVTTGNDKGSTPRRVLSVTKDGQKVVVQGVNVVFKHVKRGHPKSPQGGRLEVEMPIAASNVMYYCENCGGGVKLGYRYEGDGSKVRVCRKCSSVVSSISPARAKYAGK